MLVEWRPHARQALQDIYEYIDDRSPEAADAMFDTITSAVADLAEHPYIYRVGRVRNTREMVVHPNYLVVYRVTDRIVIVDVLHARRQYPPL
ncbi:type II toxin-antitoxin system RelE/ParE family toxin [Paraburkholderia sediminicola]|uniref:type II toxin-antitoxin system RelE/ParE family toxin n=1 Tax=Paraburkholderia sediminicola TaxID=458836 RepID=UPI0038B9EC9B